MIYILLVIEYYHFKVMLNLIKNIFKLILEIQLNEINSINQQIYDNTFISLQ